MSNYPIPPNEQQRLAKLRSYDILGMSPEQQFDDLTKLTAQILDVPICQITLMDADWQEFISNVGTDLKGNHRELSFCRYSIVQGAVLEVTDASIDDRFKDNPFVAGGPKLRYYIGAPLIDDEGLAIGTICGYDLKPRKVTEAQRIMLEQVASTAMRLIRLRKVNMDQQKYVEIFKLNLDLLCIISDDGDWIMMNPAFTAVLGYSESEMRARKVVEFIAPKHKRLALKAFAEAKKNNIQSSLVCSLMDKFGKEIQYDWSYRSDLGTKVIVASGHNMTELLTTQNNLAEAFAVAKETLISKERFISDMSHEIRTPLTAISGYMNLMKNTPLDLDQSRYVNIVESASNHLNHVVSEVLEDYRLSSNKLELDESHFDFHAMFEKVSQFYYPVALEKKIDYSFDLDPAIPKYLVGDETRLIQIFTNLLSNALKFTKSGSVKITSKLLEINNMDVCIECKVIDTGIGVSEERKATIFERFTQGAKSISRNFGGTGLGLSISQRLIELHRGTIAVESEIGCGTTFTFDLRLSLAENDHEILRDSPEQERIDLNGATILVADDNLHLQMLAGTFINRHNGQVEFATSGREVIELIESGTYDLILMDIQMPDLNGVETARLLHDNFGLRIPIIGCSAYTGTSDVLAESRGAINVMLKKPYSEDELIELIHNQLSRNTQITSADTSDDQIDNALARLREREGVELVEKLLDLMRSRIGGDIDELRTELANENLEKIKFKAHFLNSSFSAFNFKSGMQLADEIERAAEGDNSSQMIAPAKELLDFLITLEKKLRNP